MTRISTLRFGLLVVGGLFMAISLQAQAAQLPIIAAEDSSFPDQWLEWFWETTHWPITVIILLLAIYFLCFC